MRALAVYLVGMSLALVVSLGTVYFIKLEAAHAVAAFAVAK
jgi:hypothetical protein